MKFFVVILSICLVDSAYAAWNFTAVSDECIELNQQRLDLRDCCEYPKLSFYRLFSSHCIDECLGSKDICCNQICIWRNAKVTFIDGAINLDGLKKMMLDSVRHKDDWEEVISKVVDQCDAERTQEAADKMCKMPTHLAGIINCATKNFFLMCPNMHKDAKCDFTKKYVENCW